MLTEPLRAPWAVGEKVTLIVQFPCGATIEPFVQVVPVASAKSPVMPIVLILSVALPLFVSRNDCAALVVPVACRANDRLVGTSVTAGAMPVPESVTGCGLGLPNASSAMLTEALRGPVAVGVKVTLNWQLDPAAIFPPVNEHGDEPEPATAKSPVLAPARVMPETFKVSDPVLEIVTLWLALAVPTRWLPKVSDVLESITIGAIPTPESAMGCVAPGVPVASALSVSVIVAARLPVFVGVNVTLSVQVPPFAATGVPTAQVVALLLGSLKSPAFVPPTVMLVKLRAAPPLLVTVTLMAVLATPTRWLPNDRAFVESVAVGGVTPVPARLTVWVVGLASSVNVSVAARLPTAVGMNVRLTTQVPLLGDTVDAFVQVVPVAMTKSPEFVPPRATVLMCSVSEPPLVSVTVIAALVVLMI